ncbi:IPTL-CTERM sorting domain-containing protein [Brevundimonas sp.]|uniref:IPTL-CTERM sorting domain-containing protein n=1 Tax=Brevundimonas sp. TaxID=1871086 RepID=UPI00289E2956|nr:IPTL-CTERM sorting domain-containing protein [Brevundimonas sp.]
MIDGRVVVVSGRTITGLNALTRDPVTGTLYAVAKATGVTGRLLITVNVATGIGTEIGNLGDNFSSLAFRSDGQLFGVTGDGASVPETLYLINKSDATKAVATTLGNGADGEVIAYNPDDNSFYHWSGGTIVFERVLAVAPYTVTDIPITGPTNGEIFGAVWDPARGQFLVHNISSSMDFWTTSGVRSNAQAPTVQDIRGLALVPSTAAAVPTLTEWGMILFALVLGGGAAVAVHRRRFRNV